MIVFKDTKHQDRMVIGLDTQGGEQDAFIAVIDKNGNKKMLTGAY